MRNVPERLKAAAGLLSAAIIAAMSPLAASQAAEPSATHHHVVHRKVRHPVTEHKAHPRTSERARRVHHPVHPAVHHTAYRHRVHHAARLEPEAAGSQAAASKVASPEVAAPQVAGSQAAAPQVASLRGGERVAVEPVEHASAARPLVVGANYDPVRLQSGSALVVDEATNQVLLSKNANEVRPIASLTKLMTAAVTLDAHLPMDQMITITDDDIDTLKWSHSRLRPGVTLSRGELLKLALMSSENRAAHALARTYPGGVPAFVTAMNRKAAELGMTHTHYEDPTGLTPHNESSAHDLALLVRAAYAYPQIREDSTHPGSMVDVGRQALQFRNTDHLVFNHAWDIMVQKTGYINEAGHCLVLNAKVEGRHIVVVLLDAAGKYSHFGDAERIRGWMLGAGRTVLSRLDPASGELRE